MLYSTRFNSDSVLCQLCTSTIASGGNTIFSILISQQKKKKDKYSIFVLHRYPTKKCWMFSVTNFCCIILCDLLNGICFFYRWIWFFSIQLKFPTVARIKLWIFGNYHLVSEKATRIWLHIKSPPTLLIDKWGVMTVINSGTFNWIDFVK